MFTVSLIHELYVNAAMNQQHGFLIVHKTGNTKFEFVGHSREGTHKVERENKAALESFSDDICFNYIGSRQSH